MMRNLSKKKGSLIGGIININKPTGISSACAVDLVKPFLPTKTKIGHTGTLDPIATGILLMCVGPYTRLSSYLTKQDKSYRTQFYLGTSTTTFDRTGEITSIRPADHITFDFIRNKIDQHFMGEIQQQIPVYSAVKKDGVRLYEYARNGIEVEPPTRSTMIHSIELENFDPSTQLGTMMIRCSSGTYIRSIVHDLGETLQTGAHMTELDRTSVGKLSIENSVKISDLTKETISNHFLDPAVVLGQFPAVHLRPTDIQQLLSGFSVRAKCSNVVGFVRVYDDKRFLGIGEYCPINAVCKLVSEICNKE